MQIKPGILQLGAFAAIAAQAEKARTEASAAPKIQSEPTMAQSLQAQRAAWTSSVINKQPLGFVNLSGQVTGKILNLKA